MNIVPNRLSLSQLFANSNEQFVVPSYQRRYSWKTDQVQMLFQDIRLLGENDSHLFGMIILHSNYYNGGLMQPEVVDGQQRLTTLSLLLKRLEITFKNLGDESAANEIRKMLQTKGVDRTIINKIQLGDLDSMDYNLVMAGSALEDIQQPNIRNTVSTFDALISQLSDEELEAFYNKLVNVAVVIRLDVNMAQDAFKLFETINNRGLKLSATDLIKNFVLGHASKIKEDGVLDIVKVLWADIITALDGINTDLFFRQYYCSVLRHPVSMTYLVNEFKNHYMNHVEQAELLGEFHRFVEPAEENEEIAAEEIEESSAELYEHNATNENELVSIIEYIKRIKNAAIEYQKLHSNNYSSPWLQQAVKNLGSIQCLPSFIFLMHFFQNSYSKKTQTQVLEMIGTLMLRRHICERRTGENDAIFSKLCEVLAAPSEQEMLLDFKDYIYDYYPPDEEFTYKLPQYQFKGKTEQRARFILEQLEYHKKGNTRELNISGADEVHLEHIIPQTIDTKKSKTEFGDWLTYLGEKAAIKHKKHVSQIGNLTLIAGNLNIQASNNPFTRKKASYRQSSLQITKELANKADFKFPHVVHRGEEITAFAVQKFSIDFSDLELD